MHSIIYCVILQSQAVSRKGTGFLFHHYVTHKCCCFEGTLPYHCHLAVKVKSPLSPAKKSELSEAGTVVENLYYEVIIIISAIIITIGCIISLPSVYFQKTPLQPVLGNVVQHLISFTGIPSLVWKTIDILVLSCNTPLHLKEERSVV